MVCAPRYRVMSLDCASTLPWDSAEQLRSQPLLQPHAHGSIIDWSYILTMRILIASLCLLWVVPRAARAQSEADVLTGVVTDLSGHPVADAQVGATSLGSGVTRFKTTDESGRYKIYFPETAPSYAITVKRIGFSPVQRTIKRRTRAPERMTIDLQFGGTPVALSVVEVNGSSYAPLPREPAKIPAGDVSVPNPLTDILALRDSLHLSAVQVVALGDLSDSLSAR